eukprot:13669419-Ditylum_brightwellii.AAC.1
MTLAHNNLLRWKIQTRQQCGNMQLRVDLDAAYLVIPGINSCFTGYFYLAANPHPLNYNLALYNAPILVECHTLKALSALQQRQNVGDSSITHNLQL